MSRHAQSEAGVGVGQDVLVLSAGGWVPYLQRGDGLTQIQQVTHVQGLCEDLIALQGSWAARRPSTNAQLR
jgi:hypothetical protein